MDAEPDLKLQGFSIWIDDREFPDLDDYWDSNWLHIRAVVEASGARVKCDGPILRNTDFDQFRSQLEVLHRSLQGEARLEGLEPNLKLTLKKETLRELSESDLTLMDSVVGGTCANSLCLITVCVGTSVQGA